MASSSRRAGSTQATEAPPYFLPHNLHLLMIRMYPKQKSFTRQQPEDDLNKLYHSLGTKMSGIREDVRAREDSYQQVQEEVRELKLQNQKTTETMERLSEMVIQFLDNVQPKKSESAKPEVKASGPKEVLIAVESDVEEINPLREGEARPRRWFTEKPDPPKRKKSEKPPNGKSVARSEPDDSDSSSTSFSADSSAVPPPKHRKSHSSSSSSSSSSSDSSNAGVRLKEKKSSDKEDSKLRWKRFDFTLDKENHLLGWANWELWSNALSLALEEIGYEDGIKKGTKMLRTLRKTYVATGKARQRSLWKELSKITYDGGDPVQFTTKFQKLLRKVKGCGMKLRSEEYIIIFLTVMENKAGSWCKTMQSRSSKKKNDKKFNNAQKGKGGNKDFRDNKPAWNKNGGGQDEEQFIPKGLRDLYRFSGGTFSAHVNEQQLQELM
ncbi:hypothetical protein DL771_009937 [Monosporascus sp. 5C6A]|nr:hypothetical protein DL771_009937 [Monosporascus sp. 5C6A]